MEHKIERNQLRWFGHVNRMSPKQIPKKMFECRQTSKLPKGRPRKTWRESISDIVVKRGSTLKEAIKLSSNREGWRKFINAK